jgi:hypothetical protein
VSYLAGRDGTGSRKACGRAAAAYGEKVGRILFRVYVGVIALVILFVAINIGSPLTSLDTLVALLIIFGPWTAGALSGSFWGQTWVGLATAVALGVVSTSAALVAFLFLEGSSQEAACGEDECLHYFGHWIEWTLAIAWPIYAMVAWTFSVVVFGRRTRAGQAASP